MTTLLGVIANAGYVLAIQVLALVTLDAADYGAFSIQYLLYALGSSLVMSLVSDAWLRAELRDGVVRPWGLYGTASASVALSLGLVTLIISFAIPALATVAWLGAVAAAAGIYRVAARYYALRRAESRFVLPGDVAGLLVAVVLWAVLGSFGNRGIWVMVAVWAAGSVASVLFSKLPALGSWRDGLRWFSQEREHIRPLLRDSLLMDAGAIGTPYALAPFLGLADFGVYRAVSNVAAPVRLVLAPLRPKIAATELRLHRGARNQLFVLAVGAIAGVAAAIALLLIGALDIDLGTLSDVVPFAIPTAIFVGANFLGTYYYLAARGQGSGGTLMTGRIVQTVLAIAGPITGLVHSGLFGAIWAYAIVTVLSAVIWKLLVVRGQKA